MLCPPMRPAYKLSGLIKGAKTLVSSCACRCLTTFAELWMVCCCHLPTVFLQGQSEYSAFTAFTAYTGKRTQLCELAFRLPLTG